MSTTTSSPPTSSTATSPVPGARSCTSRTSGRATRAGSSSQYAFRVRIFNDDVQGTGAIVLAAMLSALKVTGGALSATSDLSSSAPARPGVGIADQLRDRHDGGRGSARDRPPARSGLSTSRDCSPTIWTTCVTTRSPTPAPARRGEGMGPQRARSVCWPTVPSGKADNPPRHLHGRAARSPKQIVEAMAPAVERPIIFPISNPTERIEAMPADLLAWTGGKALCAVRHPGRPRPPERRRLRDRRSQQRPPLPGAGLGHRHLPGRARDRQHVAGGCRRGRRGKSAPNRLGALPFASRRGICRASSAIVAAAVDPGRRR